MRELPYGLTEARKKEKKRSRQTQSSQIIYDNTTKAGSNLNPDANESPWASADRFHRTGNVALGQPQPEAAELTVTAPAESSQTFAI